MAPMSKPLDFGDGYISQPIYQMPEDTAPTKDGYLDSYITTILHTVVETVDEQYLKWGCQDHPDTGAAGSQHLIADQATFKALYDKYGGEPDWTTILLEEVAEALEETDPEDKYKELAQVAAVAIAWMDQIRRREELNLGY